MCIPVHSPWLPGYIDVAQLVLIILTIAGLFPDRLVYPKLIEVDTCKLEGGSCCIWGCVCVLVKWTLSALAGVVQWIEHRPVNQRVTSSIPSQGTCLDCGPGPQ